MGKKNVTLDSIADKAHVSKALVSRVLNNKPVRVSDDKRELILKIANELDYIPSGSAVQNALPAGLNKTIALVLPRINSSFMSVIAETITDIAYEHGYSVLLFDGKENSALEMKYLSLCHSLRLSGIIIDSFSAANNKTYLEKIAEWKIPFVFFDCYPNDSRFSIISSKNKEGAKKLTESLIARGHKNILNIIQNKSTLTNVSMERLNGYYMAMDEHHLSGCNEIIYPERDYRQQPIFSLLESSKEFSAFIIQTGTDVKHFLRLISKTKYADKPFEIGVFDDFDLPFSKTLTSQDASIYEKVVSIISQRPCEIAANAIHVLLEQIKKGDDFIPVKHFIDCDLIERIS